ncbi:hypothetical protein KBD45_07465, partial [Candidatus Dojkabacteria bacterium]|nr:hypothetical protein [Candidatus Dojkabacteria bacterium]
MHRKSPSKIWRKFQNRYLLEGVKSGTSGKTFYPPISFESGNAENKFTSVKYKKEGKLVTWSVVNAAPNGFEDIKPYI